MLIMANGAAGGWVRRCVSYLASDNAALMIGNFGAVGLRFGLNIVIARLAGAQQMGLYIALTALTYIISRITDLGLPNAIVYFARVNRSAARRCVLLCLMHSAFMLVASIVLLHFSVALGLANQESSEIIPKWWLLLGALATMQLLGGLLGQLLIPLDGIKAYGVFMVVPPIVTGWICLSMGGGIETPQILAAALVGESCACAMALGSVWWATRSADSTAPATSYASIYGYALKTYIGTCMKAVGQRGDRLVLSWFLPGSLLAAYGVAVALRDTAALPIAARSQLLRNQLTDRIQRQQGDWAAAHLKGELIRWGIVATAIGLGLSVLAPAVIPAFYGEEFRPAVMAFVILSATLPTLAVATFCWTHMLAAGKAGAVSLGLIIGGILNLIGLYIGVTMNGVVGACWGAVIAAIATAACWLMGSFGRWELR